MKKLALTIFLLFISLNVMCQEPIEPDWRDLNYAGNEQGYHTMDIYNPNSKNVKKQLKMI